MDEWRDVIEKALDSGIVRADSVGGGCVHDARRVILEDGRVLFVKQARGEAVESLQAEEHGLKLLAGRIRCPGVLGLFPFADDGVCLVMEWLSLCLHDFGSWENLGRQLAAMHAVRGDRYGLECDNFIGATPQANGWADSWSDFYCKRRLRPQLEMAQRCLGDLPVTLILADSRRAFEGYQPDPSLLHGDLWRGNTAALADGEAVVFDPASYFGDAETDLAMLELFGGPLPASFLHGYGQIRHDRMKRKPWYDLYHALNHVNLFGSDYAGMVEHCLREV